MCYMSIFLAWASDYALKTFTEWVDDTVFELVRGDRAGGEVKMVIESYGDFDECDKFRKCVLCRDLLLQSNVVDSCSDGLKLASR